MAQTKKIIEKIQDRINSLITELDDLHDVLEDLKLKCDDEPDTETQGEGNTAPPGGGGGTPPGGGGG